MNENQLRLARFLPALIFILVNTVCIMAGWQLGISAGLGLKLGLRSPGEYFADGGIRGALLGLVLGSFLSFGSFGLITSWIWRQRFSNLGLKHSLLLFLGWMPIPLIILVFVMLTSVRD